MRFRRVQENQKRVVGELRRVQMLTTYGCGAIADLAEESVIMAGPDYWNKADKEQYMIFEPQLEKYLGVDNFIVPPFEVKTGQFKRTRDIPAFRFPEWMFCPKCNRLAHYRTFGFTKGPKCMKCKQDLIPSRFVVACSSGHLDDFPYELWVHKGGTCDKGSSELYIFTSEKSAGLESIRIWCKRCGQSRTMAGSFDTKALSSIYSCSRKRPWLNDTDPIDCDAKTAPRTLQRGGSNVYFAVTASALSVPPWSKKIQIELNKIWNTAKILDDSALRQVILGHRIPEKCGCTLDEVVEEAQKKKGYSEVDKETTWQDIIEGEYRSFSGLIEDEDGEFIIREGRIPQIASGFIKQVVLADRVREVMALQGFKRLKPDADPDDPTTFNRLGRNILNWLPGMELFGEGIFLELDSKKVEEWEKKYKPRFDIIHSRSGSSIFARKNVSPRYVLVHTLSHLLIRQLILQCGYSMASIRERIYSTFVHEEQSLDMCGLFVFTASNDSEGSLGGLVSQGEPERLEETFRQMIETVTWCSSDPLCIQSPGQGFDGLNLAACHSCTLLPETSCEARNCYLDRAALVGTIDKPEFGFFYDLIRDGDDRG